MLYRPTTLPPQANPDKLRHYCRNSAHCDDKLKTPVENERDAFCCVRCHDEFYREHCRVCQEPFTSKTGNKAHKTLCDRSRCRADFRANPGAFWGRSYPRPISVKRTPKTSTISKPKMALETGRGWRIVAGPAGPDLDPRIFHTATVPDGPDSQRAGDAYERIQAENRKRLMGHFAKLVETASAEIEANGSAQQRGADLSHFAEPEWREVISPDGVRCFVTRSSRSIESATSIVAIPDDLSVPDFLKRTPPEPTS
jgi:hypothetical protein